MNLYDPLDDSKPAPIPSFIVHFIEQLEDFIVLARIYSNAVVPDEEISSFIDGKTISMRGWGWSLLLTLFLSGLPALHDPHLIDTN